MSEDNRTPMDPEGSRELEPVTQADRDAAADLVDWQQAATREWEGAWHFFGADFAAGIRRGIWGEHPVTQAFARHRIESLSRHDREVERLREYAREASIALNKLSGGGSEMFTRIGDEFYAEPDLAVERAEHRIETARKLSSSPVADKEVERVARAIAKSLRVLGSNDWKLYLTHARAAIDALSRRERVEDGEVRFTICVKDGHTSIHTQAGKGTFPCASLEMAISALSDELTDLIRCPAHKAEAALSRPSIQADREEVERQFERIKSVEAALANGAHFADDDECHPSYPVLVGARQSLERAFAVLALPRPAEGEVDKTQ